ncbi:geranylgeranyl reductase [Actinidia rufa]|uniref:Geranylgeranyl reductase n=1 Tax=Actinidia rufa TaxID=165716 RepID=A0A7J0F9H1_9ERIC|nr:geranylgeranyl reductase [Actinidia rufa]
MAVEASCWNQSPFHIRTFPFASSHVFPVQDPLNHFENQEVIPCFSVHEINQKLDEAIPVQYPPQIYEAMRYSVLAKGAKRSPPVMCVAACELFGGDRLAAFPTACALEMVNPLPSFPCFL